MYIHTCLLKNNAVERSNLCHVWFPATVATGTTQKLVCAAYRPPDCSVEYFEGEFINTYTKALSLGIEIFVLGNLNCDLLKSCCEGNTLKDLCETLNLTQLVTTPTRVTPQSSSLIDVILATNTSVVKESIVVEYHISDHYLTEISTLQLRRLRLSIVNALLWTNN